jgi:3-(3-hydroxy-phenyl)propionate hydroxylase
MHKPDTTPRHSLYYDYKVYPAAPRPAQDKARCKVVIVGAGPIGLVLALDLARHGVPSVILESEQQVSLGSRAIVFTRRSMEILQQIGGDKTITARGLPWRFGNSYYRGQKVFRMEAPYSEDDRFSPMTNLQQQYLEEAFVNLVIAEPLIDLRWGHKVCGLSNNVSSATLQVDTPEGEYDLVSAWVVACDGARSALRQMQGLKMEGASYEGRFVIADIRVDLPLPTERLAFFDPVWNRGNTVLMHREPQGIWRVDYQLRADESAEEAVKMDALKPRIDAQLEMVGAKGAPWELDWCSVYSARALTLPDYVNGRVLYCGDAAHMLPIFGVRGANTGWQDGQNLAWKLAAVVNGSAQTALLATYTEERVAAAREIIEEAGKSTRFMTPPTRGYRLLRDATLSLTLSHDFIRPLLHWRTSRPHEYSHSSLNTPDDDNHLFTGGPAKGAVMSNVKLGDQRYLMDLPVKSFCLLYFTHDALIPQALQSLANTWNTKSPELKLVSIGKGGTIDDPDEKVWRKYGATRSGVAYLIRPDQHICARWQNLGPSQLEIALRIATARH